MKSKIKDIAVLIVITFVLTLSSTIYINLHPYIDNNNNESSTNLNNDISKLSESSKSLIYQEDFNDTSNFWDLYGVPKRTMTLSYVPSDDAYTRSADPYEWYGSLYQCRVTNESEWTYSGESWFIDSHWTYPFDIYWDGINWWVMNSYYCIVQKYTSSWLNTGICYNLSSQDAYPRSIVWDGTNWWMVGNNHIVYKYDASWSYTGISYDVGSEDYYPTSIFWDGTNWWMVGAEKLRAHLYDSSWYYIGDFITDFESIGLLPKDIFWDGYYWWVLDEATSYVYMFDVNWAYTGISHDLTSQDDYAQTIFWDGINWWMAGIGNIMVYKYDFNWVYTGTSSEFYPLFDLAIDFTWDAEDTYGYRWILGYDYQSNHWDAYKYSSSWEFTGEQINLSPIVEEPIDFFFHEVGLYYVIGYNNSPTPAITRFSSDWEVYDISFEIYEDGNPESICWDGTHWWMLGSENKRVYQYTDYYDHWMYTGVSYYIGVQNFNPRDIFWDGFDWWMLGGNGIVYKYTSSWDYTGISFSLSSQDANPMSIFWDDWYSNWWMLGEEQGKVYSYLEPKGEEYSFIKKEFPYLYANYTQNSNLRCYVNDGIFPSIVDSYTTTNFNEAFITWDYQPSEVDSLASSVVIGTDWTTINLSRPFYYYLLKTHSNSIEFSSSEASSNQPTINHFLSKHYQGGGILYCQTNESEVLTLRSPNSYNFDLKTGDSIEIIFNTTSSNEIDFNLRYAGIEQKCFKISEIGNMDFTTRTVGLKLDEDMTIDQFEFSGLFDETKNLIIDEIKIYTPSIYIVTPENKTYTGPMNGYYPATYGFENDISGSFPTGWSVLETGGTAKIISELDGHNKIIELHDTSDSLKMEITQTFVDKDTGTIEYYIRKADNTTRTKCFIYDTDLTINDAVYLYFDSTGWIRYYNNSGWQNIMTYKSNQWYHLMIEWNCTAGKWYLWLDGIYISGKGYGLYGNPIAMDTIYFGTTDGESNSYSYIDAIGYSWDPRYNIGDNLIEGLLLNFKNLTALDWMGYSLDGQANKTILGNVTIPLPQDGIHSLQVFGNDSIGNIHDSIITYFTVDINPPKISINLPYDNALFSNAPPNFDLSIEGLYINTTWYTLDNGITNITFKELAGPINQTEWSKRTDGPVTIEFYANNTYGKENSSEVIVNKDTSIPIITIISPEISEFFGSVPPTFNLSITELNLNKTWYTLDNGITNITFNGLTGKINQEEWDGKVDGPVTIRFYANDSLGFKGYAERNIFKDTTKPISLISFIPHSETINVNKSTLFTIEADDGFGSGISLIRYKINDSAWIDYSDPFDLSSYEPAYYLITYYSIDLVGNIEAENTILVKLVGQPSKGAPEGIPGYNFYILISVFVVSIILFMKRYKNLK
ncbi:MAG: OmpL47-type beta-barrel domain-containing protein [Promethearchaeota archaeon]